MVLGHIALTTMDGVEEEHISDQEEMQKLLDKHNRTITLSFTSKMSAMADKKISAFALIACLAPTRSSSLMLQRSSAPRSEDGQAQCVLLCLLLEA